MRRTTLLAVAATSLLAAAHSPSQSKGIQGEQLCVANRDLSRRYQVNVEFSQGGSGTLWLDRFDARFRMSSFFGEPVETWNFRYDLGGELHLRDVGVFGTKVFSSGDENAKNKVEIITTGIRGLRVSPDLFELITIDNLNYVARTRRFITFLHGGLPGILGKSGKWGWDLPASPNWDRMFTKWNKDLPYPEFTPPKDSFLGVAEAKKEWRLLMQDARSYPKQVFKDIRVYRVQVSLLDFLARVEELKPGATRFLLDPKAKGWGADAPPSFTDSRVDAQVDAMIRGYAREGAQAGIDGRRERAIDRIVQSLGPEISSAARQRWQDAKRRRWRMVLGRELASLGQRIEDEFGRARDNAPPALSASLQRDLAALLARVKRYGDRVPPDVVRLCERLSGFSKGRSGSGFSGRLVATLRHSLPPESTLRSILGKGEDRLLIVEAEPSSDKDRLYAIDLRTGRVRWTKDLPDSDYVFPDGRHVLVRGTTYYDRFRYGSALRMSDGRGIDYESRAPYLRACRHFEERYFFPLLDRWIKVMKHGRDIECRSMSTGKVAWRHTGVLVGDGGASGHPRAHLMRISSHTFDVRTGRAYPADRSMPAHVKNVNTATLDGKRHLSGGNLVETATDRVLAKYEGDEQYLRFLAGDTGLIGYGSVWALSGATRRLVLRAKKNADLTFSPDGDVVAWRTGNEIRVYR